MFNGTASVRQMDEHRTDKQTCREHASSFNKAANPPERHAAMKQIDGICLSVPSLHAAEAGLLLWAGG